jgi:RimJ/RimL family protein N-acetyltransferase
VTATEVVAVLPDRAAGDGLVLRCYEPDDAAALVAAVTESLEHLRPWMPWIAHEPQSIEQRRAVISQWARERAAGGDAVYGIWCEDALVGGTGLHRRIGPDGLEIGYWVHVAWVGRGIATRAARLLTEVALGLPGIDRVEIHHDRANVASAGVPRRLGYAFVGTQERAPQAPAETGTVCVWRIERPAHGGSAAHPDGG